MRKDFRIGVCEDDFIDLFGRKPTRNEFKDFARLCKTAVESQIDWSIVFECVKEEMEGI